MILYLMQHGPALSKQEDPERALSEEGVSRVRDSAEGLRQLLTGFDLIVSSPKRRAHQTAALVAESVRYPYSDILVSDALLPNAAPAGILQQLKEEDPDNKVLMVGHQPHLGALACFLLGGRGEVRLEHAGLTMFQYRHATLPAPLIFHLTADLLARIAGKSSY